MAFIFEKDYPLTTTFGIPARASFYAGYENLNQLKEIVSSDIFLENEYLSIGEGSNLIFVDNYKGLVIQSAIKGITCYDKDEETAFLIIGSGEKWTDVVDRAIEEKLQGIENLAGIPGDAGSAAVQNIGAYGVEIAKFIHNIECYDTIDHKIKLFTKEECEYNYRDSFFKNEGKGRYILIRISLRLNKSEFATEFSYGSLKDIEKKDGKITTRELAQKIIEIRNSKIPDPKKTGNAGSFFKNPLVHWYYLEEVIKPVCPDIPVYPTESKYYFKVSAAWLIEKSGMKGARIGGALVSEKHSLIIINDGHASGEDVVALSKKIIAAVKEKFGILLQPEVNLIDTKINVTVLGSGTSKGVPEVGCNCRVCKSTDPHDKRLRSSVLVETMGVKILIDASPDFRQQAIVNDIQEADCLLLTHSHYDHVGGIDDLRPFCVSGKFPVFLKADVNDDLHRRIDYCFKDELYPGVPSFKTIEINDTPFYFKGIKIIPVKVYHGKLPILGYRIGSFAYITDAKTIEENELEKLRGVKVLIINTLREREHFAHLSLEEALVIINELKPQKAYLTHFCHEIGLHNEFQKKLPENVFACYDGLRISVE